MNTYEIRISGNAPLGAQGLYHRSAETPEEAKRKIAYYLRSDDGGKKTALKTSVDTLMKYMKARKI